MNTPTHRFALGLRAFVSNAALGVALTLGGLAVALVLEGCGDGELVGGSTGGKRVVLHTRVAVDEADLAAFTTPFGWTVRLEQVLVSTGPLYYFDGVPATITGSTSRARGWEYASRFLGLGTAEAHPGHYKPGRAMGQMLEPWSIDLLAGETVLADGEGVTGTYRSATFSFREPEAGPFADAIEGHVALVAGTADKEGEETRFFRAFADLEDLSETVTGGNVTGAAFETTTKVKGAGTVTVVALPHVWFRLVDFTKVEPGSADEPAEFVSGTQPRIAFSQCLAQYSAYKFSFTPDPTPVPEEGTP